MTVLRWSLPGYLVPDTIGLLGCPVLKKGVYGGWFSGSMDGIEVILLVGSNIGNK